MTTPEYYDQDLLLFFDRRPLELSLYQALFGRLSPPCPDGSVKVQKSQVSFYCPRLFAAVSLPIRRRKGWPEHCLVLTVGLGQPLDSPRAAVTVEPYPGRWTHHIFLTREEDIDGELLGWLQEAIHFAQHKGRRHI